MMGNKTPTAKAAAQNLRKQVKHLDQMLTITRQQVLEARAKGPAFQEELVRQLKAKEIHLAAHRKKITSAKAHCKKRKREIDEWKLWYSSSEEADKSAELSQLNREIEWRAADIAAKEAELSVLYTELLIAEGEYEQLSLRLEAFKTLSDSDDIDADPRIQTILEERASLSKQLEMKT